MTNYNFARLTFSGATLPPSHLPRLCLLGCPHVCERQYKFEGGLSARLSMSTLERKVWKSCLGARFDQLYTVKYVKYDFSSYFTRSFILFRLSVQRCKLRGFRENFNEKFQDFFNLYQGFPWQPRNVSQVHFYHWLLAFFLIYSWMWKLQRY